MRSLLSNSLVFLFAGLLSAITQASDSSAFVDQVSVSANAPLATERQVATFSMPGSGLINAIDIENLGVDDLAPPNEDRSVSVVIQRGDRNRAIADTQGGKNVTLQYQQGIGLVSEINLVGERNAIAVDQQGNSLNSDIYVIGGNKSILHVQRGTGTVPSHTPLIYSGTEREAELVLDTPRGRLTKAIPQ